MMKWIAALAAVFALGTASAAEAAPITVGSPLTGSFAPTKFNTVGTVAINGLPEPGAVVSSPVNGAVIAWHVIDAQGGPFKLRIVRPSGGVFVGAGTSAPATPISTAIQTFPTSLPIHAGDLIGIDNFQKEDQIGVLESKGASFIAWVPPLPEGGTSPSEAGPLEVGFNAVVQPAPTLTAISPASGSIKGGTAVTIIGTDFANVSGVSFGGVPSAGFAVTNEGQLTATAPAAKKVGPVDVTVTTVAGTTAAVATDKFTYKGCVVPQLKGKSLKAAKKRLRKASCKVGKVKFRGDATAKTGKVVKQNPKAGKKLAPGSKVNVTLG